MKTVWIGLLNLSGSPNNPILEGCLGAFVNVLAYVKNSDDFVEVVSDKLSEMELILEEVIWSESLETRLQKYDIEDYLLELATTINNQKECYFGIFHVWENDD